MEDKEYAVIENMGEYSLMFVEFSFDQKHYRMANNPNASWIKTHEKWRATRSKMGNNKNICVLTANRKSTRKTASGVTFDIVDLLAVFPDFKELSETNKIYWKKLKKQETALDKFVTTYEFVDTLVNAYTKLDREHLINAEALIKLRAIAEEYLN